MSRTKVPATTMQTVYLELRKDWLNTAASIAKKLQLDIQIVKQSLVTFTQAGKVIYDLKNNVYRIRELKREGIDIEALRFSSDIDKEAYQLMENGEVSSIKSDSQKDKVVVTALVRNKFTVSVSIDSDLKIIDGKCTCNHYHTNKLTKGPCAHILATRIAFDKE
jgi:hypothetical protein